METKELKIQVPEGYEIDKENSTFDCIKFKSIKKDLTYNDVAFELFSHNRWIIKEFGNITNKALPNANVSYPTLCTSEKQAKKLLAINKLMNVARYLNGSWEPNWMNDEEYKYSIYYWVVKDSLTVDHNTSNCHCTVYFKELELAKEAIKILGEETVKLAVSTNW